MLGICTLFLYCFLYEDCRVVCPCEKLLTYLNYFRKYKHPHTIKVLNFEFRHLYWTWYLVWCVNRANLLLNMCFHFQAWYFLIILIGGGSVFFVLIFLSIVNRFGFSIHLILTVCPLAESSTYAYVNQCWSVFFLHFYRFFVRFIRIKNFIYSWVSYAPEL